ncbi:hypothetical protein DVA67_027795 [Solirubrobacter sp. CPCC 204708]|uniref:DUF2207 domain-containing protein n=1 Tax=Solirubrobacter deserti TaxID=2282478 RepID=A0ABT4RJS8_9ACTN|nr:hypothetical protein [Solirubrobacter deserti]MBE2319799.1 hypothetical protein [Solirubrobacter deserti]MDA0138718.1 hypothetical protein [Solirubrobacter deserti]
MIESAPNDSMDTHGWLYNVLLLAAIASNLAAIGWLFRMLAVHPAPVAGRLSLRRQALKLLSASNRRKRWTDAIQRRRQRLGWTRFVIYAAALFVVVLIPVDVRWGPLDDVEDSEEFLRTLWQVVGAALGVSVAMVAFAFEAFRGSGQQAYGGSLREFAGASRLLLVIEIGLVSLLLDGVVLFGWGHNAPRGLPAAWAIIVSGITLVGVGYVMHRVVRLLDDSALRRMREERVRRLVDQAMTQQLVGQAATLWLGSSSLPIRTSFGNPGGATPIVASRAGEVVDVRLGPLSRFAVRHPNSQLWLPVNLGDSVAESGTGLYLTGQVSPRKRRRLAAAVRVRRADDESGNRALTEALERLHQQAMGAARGGRENEWRAIGQLYELVLLALPKAAAAWGIPFAGAVMAPGFFGVGPVQRIADFLYDELVAAVNANSRELIGPITYLPQHVAIEATRLGAPALAAPLFQLYPAMYALARRGRA